MKRNSRNLNIRQSESGQAIALMVLLLTALIGIVAVAIDGGRAYYNHRYAQNAADNASLAGALAMCSGNNLFIPAFASAATNGFNNDGLTNSVSVNNPPSQGPNAGDSEFIEVIINSTQTPALAQMVFSAPLQSTVRAVSQCDTKLAFEYAIFGGAESCQNTVDWSGSSNIVVGGVHTNNDIKMSGSSNLVLGEVTYVSTVNGTTQNVTYDPPPPDNPVPGSVEDYPVNYEIGDYAPGGSVATTADAAGEYYACDCKMDKGWLESEGLYDDATKILQDGLYYTSEEIDLSLSSVTGNAVTFVARETISFSGPEQDFQPYTDGLHAFTDEQKMGDRNAA